MLKVHTYFSLWRKVSLMNLATLIKPRKRPSQVQEFVACNLMGTLNGCTNPQIFGTSPIAPADFDATSTMCTRCFETQSSPGCTCTHRFKFHDSNWIFKKKSQSRFGSVCSRYLQKILKRGGGGVTFGIQKTPISAMKTGNFLTEQSYSSNGITKNQKSILW